MRSLGIIVLREWDHFRRSFLLLLGTVGLAVLMHVLVLTIIPGTALAEFLVIFKSIVIPGLFVLICGMMGYADSPERGSHDFRTRPIRVRALYAGKLLLIAVIAVGLVSVQSLMNLAAGFPMDFLTLWWPLFMAGTSAFFVAGVVRPKLGTFLCFGVMALLVWIGMNVAVKVIFGNLEMPFSEPGLRRFLLVAVMVSLCLFLGRNMIPSRWLRWAGFAALAFGSGFLIYILPVDLRKAELDEDDELLNRRLHPHLEIEPDRAEGVMKIAFPEEPSREMVLRRLSFRPQVVGLTDEAGQVFRIPVHERYWDGWGSSEELLVIRALGLAPWLTGKEISDARHHLFDRRQSWIPVPDELEGRKLTVVAEGRAHLTEVTELGILPMKEGAKILGDDVTVELLELQTERDRVRLRVHSRSGSSIRVGAFQKNPKNFNRPYGEIKWLTNHEVTRGISSVDFVEVGVHFKLVEEFPEAAELHLFVVRYEGNFPFKSKPETITWDGGGSPQKMLRADYPILPSITPYSSK